MAFEINFSNTCSLTTIPMTAMLDLVARVDRRKRGTLTNISLGLYDDQLDHIAVLKRVTGKGQGRILRDAIDAYFRSYRIGDDTLGDAEQRFKARQASGSGGGE